MIHWCGSGLSSGPGLRRLLLAGHDVTVWERDLAKARDAVGDLTDQIVEFDPAELSGRLKKGDIVVSMLPTDQQLPMAMLAITHHAHFISSSYLTAELRALDDEARDEGASVLCEVGLDPGIDHLMAHWLVADYRAASAYQPDNALSFHSYCGGVPAQPNAFRYKFSWSPGGVLRALAAPSRSIRHYSPLSIARPWEALGSYTAPLAHPEVFEVYPNRDSLPFIREYRFDPGWKIKDFVRGTLRLNGWAEAWKDIFAEIESNPGPEGEAHLDQLAETLWAENAYAKDEPDRVVLCVSLKAERDGRPVYHKTWALDATGDVRGSAMARLVSVPVALAVEAVLAREIPVGVHAAPSDPKLVTRWLDEVQRLSQMARVVDHLGR